MLAGIQLGSTPTCGSASTVVGEGGAGWAFGARCDTAAATAMAVAVVALMAIDFMAIVVQLFVSY